MIFIVVKFKTKPEWSDRWLDLVHDFTEATRAEPGNLWFEWSRSELEGWARRVAKQFGYSVRFSPVGPVDHEVGAPTQMAVFSQ